MCSAIDRIVTHAGQAHRDEFLACAFMLRNSSANIVRRDPTEIELKSSRVIVIDVGLDHTPDLNNFDHHQFVRDAAPACALSLVMGHLGYDMKLAREIFPWLGFTEVLDSKGPFVAAASVGIERDKLQCTLSPIEAQVLQMFGDAANIHPTSTLASLMVGIADGICNYYGKVAERLNRLSDLATQFDVNGVPVMDVTEIDRDDNPTLGLEMFCDGREINPAVTITQDDRGDGLCLFRRNDDSRIDFSRINGKDGVVFAHTNGFVAKIKPSADCLDLIKQSIVS